MDQLIPSLATLIEPFRGCFHPQVFQTFQALLAGWIVCQGPRTISEVWLATGLAARRHHDTAYAVFHSAVWEGDDLLLAMQGSISISEDPNLRFTYRTNGSRTVRAEASDTRDHVFTGSWQVEPSVQPED